MKQSRAIRAIAVAACAACAIGAHATTKPKSSVAYVGPFDFDQSYLVDWNTARLSAHVTLRDGQSDGTYTDDGTQRLVTLKTPIVRTGIDFDSCGNQVDETTTVQQLVFRPAGAPHQGTAQVVEMGTITTVGGCTPGTVPYGSPTDPGESVTRLDMTLRPSTSDIGIDTQLAGLTETTLAGMVDTSSMVADIATFEGNAFVFATTTDWVTEQQVDGWYVLGFADGHVNAFTRIAVDATTGAETWLAAPWANGAPAAVHNVMMAKVDGTGGWKSRGAAAHKWFEAIFADSDALPYFDLYGDGTGDFLRISPVDGSVESDMPAYWSFVGANLQISRSLDFTQSFHQRTWVPLADHGTNRLVLEHEDNYDAQGNFLSHNILPRVNWYVDEGKAVKPASVAPRKAAKAHAPRHQLAR